jgi:nicotinamide riboside kinase|tara:strand:+ start:36 stop:623 length:588 start_codon:yes stop_codon:yes gene_type:complete
MIFSFTGAQSTGKTTLLNHLHKCNGDYPFEFVPEVTRLVSREYDMPINETGDNLTQMLIMTEHVRNIYKNKADRLIRGVHKIFDRCALDGIVYSLWLLQEGKIGRRCYDACDLLWKNLKDKYDVIFYTSPDDVELEDDGERSTNARFRNEIINIFNVYLARENFNSEVITLKGSVEERLEIVKSALAKHDIDIKI